MKGCLKFASCLLCFFMLVMFTIGLAFIAVGTVMLVELYVLFLDGVPVNSTSTIFIISGIVSIFLSFLVLFKVGSGKCLDIICDSNFCYAYLTTFIFIIMAVSVCEIIGAVNFLIVGNVTEVLQSNMAISLKQYSPYESSGISHSWNTVHHLSSCCGVNSYTDWTITTYYNYNSVPDSCCIVTKAGCGQNLPLLLPQISEIIHTRGCLNEIGFETNYLISLSKTLGLVFGVLQLIGVSCALVLIKPIRRCYKTREYQAITDSPSESID